MSGNAGQQENIMNPDYQAQSQSGYQPVYTEQNGQGPGYYFSPFDHPAQKWPTQEMFMAEMAMQSTGTSQMYDYLRGVKTWYPEPRGRGGGSGGGGPMFQPDHIGPNLGEGYTSSPHGINPHGHGYRKGGLNRSQREDDPSYRVETTPGKAKEGGGFSFMGIKIGGREPDTHEVISTGEYESGGSAIDPDESGEGLWD